MDKNNDSQKYRLGEINLNNPKNSHDFQILFTGSNKKVLEIGTATGYISKILKEKNCHVTGVEINPEWANEATKYVDRMIIGNIEDLNFEKEFVNEKFDVILMGDSLEHLKNPKKVLNKFHFLLNDDGYLVCSIPNISYAPIRLHLLNGEFLYESTGILDETHYHLYTLDNVILMLDKSNFRIFELHRIKEKFHLYHRTDLKHRSFSDDLISSLSVDPESETFQFVFKAKPKTLVNINTREYVIQNFPKNYVSEELKQKIDDYIRHIQYCTQQIQYLDNVIIDKDQFLEKVIIEKDQFLEQVIIEKDQFLEQVIIEKDQFLEKAIIEKDQFLEKAIIEKDQFLKDVIIEKDQFLEDVIIEKDKFLENVIASYKNQINEIKNSKIWKIAKLIDKLRK